MNREHGVIVGKIAHIKARSENGPRFDHTQSPEDNRAPANLMALCGEHHDIIDERDDIYTVERLQAMKEAHEEKIEGSADRSWIRFPNQTVTPVVSEDGPIQHLSVFWWVDRNGCSRIYTDRQRIIAQILMRLYQDLNALCQLQEAVKNNPNATGDSFAQQNYLMMKVKGINPDDGEPWTPIAHILRTMAMVPEITFGEFVQYLVQSGDATGLLVAMAEEFEREVDNSNDDN